MYTLHLFNTLLVTKQAFYSTNLYDLPLNTLFEKELNWHKFVSSLLDENTYLEKKNENDYQSIISTSRFSFSVKSKNHSFTGLKMVNWALEASFIQYFVDLMKQAKHPIWRAKKCFIDKPYMW